MAGFTVRLLLRRIAGADRNLSARVPVKPMNGPAPSIAQDFVLKGFSFTPDRDDSPESNQIISTSTMPRNHLSD
jgi:hypothetical protein